MWARSVLSRGARKNHQAPLDPHFERLEIVFSLRTCSLIGALSTPPKRPSHNAAVRRSRGADLPFTRASPPRFAHWTPQRMGTGGTQDSSGVFSGGIADPVWGAALRGAGRRPTGGIPAAAPPQRLPRRRRTPPLPPRTSMGGAVGGQAAREPRAQPPFFSLVAIPFDGFRFAAGSGGGRSWGARGGVPRAAGVLGAPRVGRRGGGEAASALRTSPQPPPPP